MISYLFSNPLIFIIYLMAILVAIAIHEFSHAWAADYLGDPTPRLQGRLKLNPLVHIDKIGMLFLLFFGFGWGKPTPFDPFNLRNIKRDSALISVAGAVSNFLLAILLSIPYLVAYFTNTLSLTLVSAYQLISIIIWINVILGVFNLIPIHPLDGFKVLAGLLPRDWYHDFIGTERYGIFILLFLLITGNVGRIIFPIVSLILSLLLPGSTAPF